MIRVEGLVRRFGSKTAVDGVSFHVARGEVVGFLGPNGAGKTTTLRIIAGFLNPSAGDVDVCGLGAAADSLDCRSRIGYLPENNPLYEEMEVCEYLDWCGSVRGLAPGPRREALSKVVGSCGLAAVAGEGIAELSKGYRQRVGLAAALIHDPEVLLLDEPTSGLDPNQAVEIRRLIADLGREKAVLISSHILPEVQASCGRVIIIHKGRIAAQGRTDALGPSGAREELILLSLGRMAPGLRKDVKSRLAALPGVVAVALEERGEESALEIRAEPQAADLRERIFALAVELRWPVRELHRETRGLEEVFRSLTA